MARHGRDDRRHEHLVFEVEVAVEQLRREERAGERRVEERPDARAHAGGHELAARGDRQAQRAREPRTEARADLRDRALAPGRAAGADEDRRRERLHGDRDRPHASAAEVVGLDRGVRAVARGLRRELLDEPAREQPAERGQQGDRPAADRPRRLRQVERLRLVRGAAERDAPDLPEEEPVEEVEHRHERDRAEPGEHADDHREHERAPDAGAAVVRRLAQHPRPCGKTGFLLLFRHRQMSSRSLSARRARRAAAAAVSAARLERPSPSAERPAAETLTTKCGRFGVPSWRRTS